MTELVAIHADLGALAGVEGRELREDREPIEPDALGGGSGDELVRLERARVVPVARHRRGDGPQVVSIGGGLASHSGMDDP
jgi:hypothetical protein